MTYFVLLISPIKSGLASFNALTLPDLRGVESTPPPPKGFSFDRDKILKRNFG